MFFKKLPMYLRIMMRVQSNPILLGEVITIRRIWLQPTSKNPVPTAPNDADEMDREQSPRLLSAGDRSIHPGGDSSDPHPTHHPPDPTNDPGRLPREYRPFRFPIKGQWIDLLA